MKKNKKKEERELDKKKSLKIIDIKKILAYSAIKINANPTKGKKINNFIQNRFNEKFKKNLKDPPRIR
jgi:alkyl sulfatase BDS1-like metallo-beta-lactamase superfamily hydrolase